MTEEPVEEDTYKEAKPKFLTDYDIENPITRNKAIADLWSNILERSRLATYSGVSSKGGESIYDGLDEYAKTVIADSKKNKSKKRYSV